MSDPKTIQILLNKLHSKLEKLDTGDHPYHQFRYLWSRNGDDCEFLGKLASQLPMDIFQPELDELIKAIEVYKKLGRSASDLAGFI
jgi:hypothetical protein